MNLSNRRLWVFGAIAIGAIVLLTLLAAPTNNKLSSGSTYTRAANGYGAWYAFMEERGTPIQRWKKSFPALASNETIQPPVTLLRVNSGLSSANLIKDEQNWVKKGNNLVILGVRQPVTNAPFSTQHQTETGSVKIDTRRRSQSDQEKVLGDRFGSIVWQETMGNGNIIYATTPHIAANAYQDFRDNYEFLAQLVTQSGVGNSPNSVWVDEYIHGYKDSENAICQEPTAQPGTSPGKRKGSGNINCEPKKPSLWSYLAKTPVYPAFLQGLILLLVAIWAGNRRFGKPVTLPKPEVNNSKAYIQALAGVLQKAESSEFILDIVGKDEQLQLQKALFLGPEQLDLQTLVNAWVQQTGRPATELEQVLRLQAKKHRMSEKDLLSWLKKWEEIRHHLSSSEP